MRGAREQSPGHSAHVGHEVEVHYLRGVGFARLPISLAMSYIEKGEMETALDEYAATAVSHQPRLFSVDEAGPTYN
jgi:hypothetical protein